MPRKLMGALAAASAVGFINMIGNLGGGVGSMIVGSSSHLPTALYILAGMPLLAAAIIIGIGVMRKQELAADPAAPVEQQPAAPADEHIRAATDGIRAADGPPLRGHIRSPGDS
jgi:hypothetical protein